MVEQKEMIVQRLRKEFADLQALPVEHFSLYKYPLSPFKWHFVFYGPKGTPFENGVYHGDVLFDGGFPINPPQIVMNTYNGRLFRGRNIVVIPARWWDASMTVRAIFSELTSMFVNGSPRPSGTLFEEDYRLRILAERSQFSGCPFCRIPERTTANNRMFIAALERWKRKETDTTGEGIGQWWHEERLVVIKHSEMEIERIGKRHYPLLVEKYACYFNAYLILLNWRSVARHVLAPIIYRFFLLAFLIGAFVNCTMLASSSYLTWSIRTPAVVDCIAMIVIGLFEAGAIYAFFQSRQLRGTVRDFSNLLGTADLVAIFAHICCAIAVCCKCAGSNGIDKGTIRTNTILYAVFAFGNDFYHYTMGILFYLNMLLCCIFGTLERLLRFQPCIQCIKYKVVPGTYTEGNMGTETCFICLERFVAGEDVYTFGCNPKHVFHKKCANDLANVDKRCPMCKRHFELPPEESQVLKMQV